MKRIHLLLTLCLAFVTAAESNAAPKRVAAIVTVFTPRSHAEVIVGRLLQSYTLDGQGEWPQLQLASLYIDQKTDRDIGPKLAARKGARLCDTVSEALTLGGAKLAVDGVLLVCEHGNYPVTPTGQVHYPKRRLFDEVVKVMAASNQTVPIFIDKHICDNWNDAKDMFDTAARMHIPLMAGSSLPGTWRYPAIDVPRGAKLDEVVAVSYHTLDCYGFHALEMLQAIVERRAGGETGIKNVQCLTGDAVWEAGGRGVYDSKLLDAALDCIVWKPPKNIALNKAVTEATLWNIEYRDGLKAHVLTLNYVVGQWGIAWRLKGEPTAQATMFWTQEEGPILHFRPLVEGIERMMLTGKPAWPAERTLLTSGVLDRLLISKQQGGRVLETPELAISYKLDWQWRQPPIPTGPRSHLPPGVE